MMCAIGLNRRRNIIWYFVGLHFPSHRYSDCQWLTEGGLVGGGGVEPPPQEIPKSLQNCAKLNPIVKTVKIAEFRMPTL